MSDNPLTAPPADLLLDEAAALWATTRRGYRDGMLRVGDLLHRYLAARPEASRWPGVRRVRDRLKVTTSRAAELVAAAAVVRLLGPPGGLSYSSVRAFRVALARAPGRGEEWGPRPGHADWAAATYRAAAAAGWGFAAVNAALAARFGRGTRAGGRVPRKPPVPPAPPAQILLHVREPGRKASGCPLPEGLLSVARRATPADLADLVEVLVSRSPDPPAAAALVAERMRGVRAAGPARLTLAGVI